MSRKEDIPVGGILTRKNGKCYEVTPKLGCTGCAFLDKKGCSPAQCVGASREDNTWVIFIRRKDLDAEKEELK